MTTADHRAEGALSDRLRNYRVWNNQQMRYEAVPLLQEAASAIERLTRPTAPAAEPVGAEMAPEKILDHKWLDPKCVECGCQSLVWQGRYESAVKGRAEFRQAYREQRAKAGTAAEPVGAAGIPRATGQDAENGWRLDFAWLDKLRDEIEHATGYRITIECLEEAVLRTEAIIRAATTTRPSKIGATLARKPSISSMARPPVSPDKET